MSFIRLANAIGRVGKFARVASAALQDLDGDGLQGVVVQDRDAGGQPLGAITARGRGAGAPRSTAEAERVQRNVTRAADRLAELFGELYGHERKVLEKIAGVANQHYKGAELLERVASLLDRIKRAEKQGRAGTVFELMRQLDEIRRIINTQFLGQLEGLRPDAFVNLKHRRGAKSARSSGVIP